MCRLSVLLLVLIPKVFLMESEDEEGISWAEKPLAIILFSVCGALIIVILIICCFLAVNRRRVEKKRERRAAKEKQRRHYLLPTACLGLNNGCYPKPSSAWPPNADHAAHVSHLQAFVYQCVIMLCTVTCVICYFRLIMSLQFSPFCANI